MNPSAEECAETSYPREVAARGHYFPLVARSGEALAALVAELEKER